jgi:glyoxylase-like metal-dependent hydrolase (beta-lactamase superfamily II)
MVRNLAQVGLQVSDLDQVIVTHGDYDHTQGFHDLVREHPALRLYLHRNDWLGVQESDAYRTASYVYGRSFVPFEADQCLPLDDGDVLAAGDAQLVIHHSPGHTEGSVCLLGEIDGHRVLFAGDVIGGAMKSLDGAVLQIWVDAVASWTQSLSRLATLEFEWILNGHEPAPGLPITRSRFDRLIKSFGTMMNPWFLLEEDELLSASPPASERATETIIR